MYSLLFLKRSFLHYGRLMVQFALGSESPCGVSAYLTSVAAYDLEKSVDVFLFAL